MLNVLTSDNVLRLIVGYSMLYSFFKKSVYFPCRCAGSRTWCTSGARRATPPPSSGSTAAGRPTTTRSAITTLTSVFTARGAAFQYFLLLIHCHRRRHRYYYYPYHQHPYHLLPNLRRLLLLPCIFFFFFFLFLCVILNFISALRLHDFPSYITAAKCVHVVLYQNTSLCVCFCGLLFYCVCI